MKMTARPHRRRARLQTDARYLTPSGRVCRLVRISTGQPEVAEAMLAYEVLATNCGPRELGERFSMRLSVAERLLTRIG